MKRPAAVWMQMRGTAVAIERAPGGLDAAGVCGAKSPRGIRGGWNTGETCYFWRILCEKAFVLGNTASSRGIKTFMLLL